jgi:hypothetical protein
VKEHPEDICRCGDYRRQHPDGGACGLNGLGHGTCPGEGWTREDDKCQRFRLVLLHHEYLELTANTRAAVPDKGDGAED